MRKYILILFIAFFTLNLFSQTLTKDTTYVCLNDTSLFVNEQYLGTTMYQHGIMYTFGDDVKSQTVPKNYVFSPPYDSFTHIDTFMVVWKTNGSFNIKKIDYDFNGLIFIDTMV